MLNKIFFLVINSIERIMGSDINGEILGNAYKGYTIIVTGGNYEQIFTMKQDILVNGRVRALMKGSKLIFIIPIFGKVFFRIHYYETNCWLALLMFQYSFAFHAS